MELDRAIKRNLHRLRELPAGKRQRRVACNPPSPGQVVRATPSRVLPDLRRPSENRVQ
jgi:hypothetical protein